MLRVLCPEVQLQLGLGRYLSDLQTTSANSIQSVAACKLLLAPLAVLRQVRGPVLTITHYVSIFIYLYISISFCRNINIIIERHYIWRHICYITSMTRLDWKDGVGYSEGMQG